MDEPELNPVDAPQKAPPPVEGDALDAVRLEVRVEELERRLRARSLELETELKAKERLRERVRELTARAYELQQTVSALHREAASATSLARELDDTLKVAAEARVQLGAALEAERGRRLEAETAREAVQSGLGARVEALDAELRRTTAERDALIARAGSAENAASRTEGELARARDEIRILSEAAGNSASESRKRDDTVTWAVPV